MEMKKHARTDLFLILCGVLVWFLADASRVREAAARALVLCLGTVVPALFPFLALSSLLLALGFAGRLAPYVAGLT
ncbi:MAG: sporulation protein, partial [Oscillibacter sp.]|nr:sporulation protein [Oscillibacter sp.]